MSKKQKIDPDYFLALTLQRKFNEEYKKEKDGKAIRSQDVEPSCTSHELPVSPIRKKPLGSAILIDPLPFTRHPNPKPLESLPRSSSTPTKYWSSSQSASKSHSQSPSRPLSLNDSQWEVIDPTPDVHGLFVAFGRRFFQDRLGSVEVKWSKRMTSCAGVCRFKGRRDRSGRGIGEVTISLSEPLLKLRPRSDLVNTLLHEMIHAYLFLFTENPNRADRDDHGQEFQQHMRRINGEAGTKITVYHSFHDEVKLYKTHWWQCDGPCRSRPPFHGLVKRATNRAPGKSDFWFANHQAECGGQFIKIKEPENFKARGPRKNKNSIIGGSAGSPNIGGRISSGGGGMGSVTTGGKAITTSGNPHTNSKHVPTPGQPKIVGFVDLSKQGGSSVNPMGSNKIGTNSASRNKSGSNSGGYTLGSSPKMTTTFGGGTLGSHTGSNTSLGGCTLGASNHSGSNSGRTLGNNGYTLSTPGNYTGPSDRVNSNRLPGNGSNIQAGPSNPIGSKLLDKLKFDSKNGNSGSFGNNTQNTLNNRGNANSNPRGNNSHSGGIGMNRGFGAGMAGTRMNKGSGTVVLNPKKGGTMTSPNETTERITKPINKTEKPTPSTENSKTGSGHNRLNIDHFEPFMGSGQTLGGGSGGTDSTRSRLLANVGASSRNIGNNSGKNSCGGPRNNNSGPRNNVGASRNNAGSSGNTDWASRNDVELGSRNKKPCLGNRSLYSSGEASTSQSNGPYHTNSNGNKKSSSSQSTPGKMDLSWELSDDVMDGDYEFKRVNSRFTQPNNDKNSTRTDSERIDSDDDCFENMETNKDTTKNRNVNMNDSFEEMEKMMNDSDIEVFENISDETLSGYLGNGGDSTRDTSASSLRKDAYKASTSSQNRTRDENNHATVSKHNDSLDDMFEMSSEDENNGYDDENENGGDDETHCPVCNKPIARASMSDHLENCMELSQVFDNVVIDDDEEDEFEQGNVENGNETVNRKQNSVRENDVGNRHDTTKKSNSTQKTSKEDKSECHRPNKDGPGKSIYSNNRDRPDEIDGKTRDRKPEHPQQGSSETTRHHNQLDKNRERYGDTRNNAGPSPMEVKCPICNADILESTANEHIDECLARNIAQDLG